MHRDFPRPKKSRFLVLGLYTLKNSGQFRKTLTIKADSLTLKCSKSTAITWPNAPSSPDKPFWMWAGSVQAKEIFHVIPLRVFFPSFGLYWPFLWPSRKLSNPSCFLVILSMVFTKKIPKEFKATFLSWFRGHWGSLCDGVIAKGTKGKWSYGGTV